MANLTRFMRALMARRRAGWRLAAVLATSAVAASLAGCGFTPLYATPGMTPALASVTVEVPQNREGYLLREQLNEELGHDNDTPSRYRLILTDTESRYPRGIFVNNVASRYEIALGGNYALSDAVTGKVLLQGNAPVEVSFDAATPPYSSVAASQDGEVRAANQAAIVIRAQLARFFDRLAEPPAPAAPLGTQLPAPALAGPRSAGPDVPSSSIPEPSGFGGSNTDPQTIGVPPPPVPTQPQPQTPQ